VKILVLSNLYPPDMLGGYELGCRQAVEALRARGHDVRVLTAAPRRPVPHEPGVRRNLKLTEIWSRYLFERGHAVTAHLNQAESHRVNAANVHALLAELDEFRPDVVYAFMLVGVGGLGLMACLEYLGVPWVWHLMDDLPRLLCEAAGRVPPELAREFLRHLGRGRYLACSRQLVDEIERAGFPISEQVQVVPNWVAGETGPPRAEYLQGGVLRVASAAGVLDRRIDKGIDLVIESAARLRDRGHSNFVVDIYGQEADGYFDTLIAARDLRRHVTIRGPRPHAELLGLLAGYDVFAFPTHAREPFAFAALEASARGCVPLMSAVCGNAEWVVHGVHALKAPRTSEAFADALEAILDGRVDLAGIGARGGAVVRRDFHLDAIVVAIEGALADAAASPRPGPVGRPDDAYRLAMLAERLGKVIIQESLRQSA
jgi:glycosyltransferase involved in cell wall biosynthesis